MVGTKVGRLVVVEWAGSTAQGKRLWLCSCECGGEVTATTDRLRAGRVRSCGCLRSEMLKKKWADYRARILEQYEVVGTCWEWRGGALNADGYGEVKVRGRSVKVHRLSYQRAVGAIPRGKQVLHHCDNPSCINPEHLWVGTHWDNMRDMAQKGRTGGVAAGHTVLTPKDVREIRSAYVPGKVTYAEIAERYGVSAGTIGRIVNRQTWKNI